MLSFENTNKVHMHLPLSSSNIFNIFKYSNTSIQYLSSFLISSSYCIFSHYGSATLKAAFFRTNKNMPDCAEKKQCYFCCVFVQSVCKPTRAIVTRTNLEGLHLNNLQPCSGARAGRG
jgi:hypothetical protein